MKKHAFYPSLVLAQDMADALTALDFLPRAGVPWGGGRHVTTPLAWDGMLPVPPGWTDVHRPVAHPTHPSRYRVVIPAQSNSRRQDPERRENVPPGLLAKLDDDADAASETLPAEWIPA